ncbi:MAG: hypothetical protein HKN14_15980 [Marinicaulis sp.]|nr:hypothetical protein [Marinicaulis sp.]
MAFSKSTSGKIYDVKPAGEHPYFHGGSIAGLIGFALDAFRGACAGLLGLLGASHTTGAGFVSAPAAGEMPGLTQVMEQMSVGGLAGPVELLGGLVLFLTTRRTIARTLGLLGFIGLMAAYSNGYSLDEILLMAAGGLQRASEFLEGATAIEAA